MAFLTKATMIPIKNGGHVPYPEVIEITGRWFVIRPSKFATVFTCLLWAAFLLATFSPWICDMLRSWNVSLPAFLYEVRIPNHFTADSVIGFVFPAVISFACFYVWVSWIFWEVKTIDGLERVIRYSKSSEVIEFTRVTSVYVFQDLKSKAFESTVFLICVGSKSHFPLITRVNPDKAEKVAGLLNALLQKR